MVQFEYPMVIHLLYSFSFGVYIGDSLSLHAEKRECFIWPSKKFVNLLFQKLVSFLIDSKWSNSNTPLSFIPWSHSLLESKNKQDSKTPTRVEGNVLYSVLQEISRQMGSADTFPYPKSVGVMQGSAIKFLLGCVSSPMR